MARVGAGARADLMLRVPRPAAQASSFTFASGLPTLLLIAALFFAAKHFWWKAGMRLRVIAQVKEEGPRSGPGGHGAIACSRSPAPI